MTAPVAPPPASPTSAWSMYRALVGTGAVCGLLIVTAYQITLPRIERNKAEALERAILQVLPGAATSRTFAWVDGQRFEPLAGPARGEPVVHAGFDAAGALVGVAIEGVGMGYQDSIRLLFGYAPATEKVIGLQVLESKETPGLGDKILVDPTFLANFAQLDVAMAPSGDTLANPVRAVKHGEKREEWEVDGITGATISSRAVADIVTKSATVWLPRIRANGAEFSAGGDR